MGTILLKNITVDGLQSDILVVGNRIDRTGPAGSCTAWPVAGEFEVLECSGKAALPGFINMHTHSGMSLMRGVGEDMPLEEWLQKIWKLEEGVCYPLVHDAVRLACVEMIKSGTTTFNDQYWLSEACHDAAVSMGMRPSMGYDLLDMCDPLTAARQKDECEEHYEKYSKLWKDDGSIYTLSFHAIYTVTEKMMLWASEFARSHGIKLHIHLSETRTEVENCKKAHGGLTPVEYLAELGILGPEVLAAHTSTTWSCSDGTG